MCQRAKPVFIKYLTPDVHIIKRLRIQGERIKVINQRHQAPGVRHEVSNEGGRCMDKIDGLVK
jgi:hypothetical protein